LAIKVDIIYNKHIFDALKEIPDNFIDTIVTSPPYWGLRDYGEDTKTQWPDGWYGQLGLEPTLDLYIEHLLQVTKELKRVLKPTGVMFWNHNDCYGGSGCGKGDYRNNNKRSLFNPNLYSEKPNPQLKLAPKCLALQNYRLILRMIDEQGWILRNIIIWYKPNAMPSSVKDRFSNRYEPVFMLTKRRKYWFDLDAVRVPHKENSIKRDTLGYKTSPMKGRYKVPWEKREGTEDQSFLHPLGKNPGDVWKIATQPFPEAHFATFPEKLVEPMIRCACPKWICKKCGKAKVRITEKNYIPTRPGLNTRRGKSGTDLDPNKFLHQRDISKYRQKIEYYTIGWTDCDCNAGFDAGIVLDPFAGAGTTLVVAKRLGRHYIGIEIKAKYVEMAKRRVRDVVCQEELF